MKLLIPAIFWILGAILLIAGIKSIEKNEAHPENAFITGIGVLLIVIGGIICAVSYIFF